MQKKILLKKTREYLQSSFPENLLPARKLRQSKKKLFFHRTRNLKTQVIKAKKEVFNQYATSAKKLFALKDNIVSNKNVTFYNPKTFPRFMQGINQVFPKVFMENDNLVTKVVRNLGALGNNNFSNPLLKTSYKDRPNFISNEQSASGRLALPVALAGTTRGANLNKQDYLNISYPEQTKFVQSYPPFLFSTNQIQYELSRKKTRSSDFKKQLKERKKLALIYGQLSKKYIKKTLKQAAKLNGKKHDNFFFLLEARLDVVMFRACFFSSIKSARQWINHNKILVNNQFINTSSYRLRPGDIISIKAKDRILLCRKIMHLLKKSFFKQNKSIPKQFSISTFLFKKLKSCLKPLGNTHFLIDHFKKNSLYLNSLSNQFREAQPLPLANWSYQQVKTKFDSSNETRLRSPIASWIVTSSVTFPPLGENLVCTKYKPWTEAKGRNTEDKFSVKKSLNYKQFLFQVKQVLRFVLNKYSNKNRYLKNTNSFASHLSQTERNTLISNLIELEYLEKRNLESLEGLRGFLIHLKLKKLFFKSEKKKKSFTILNKNVLKPLNLEISYKNLVIIYLYPPQKITFACSIDMELISRSLA